MRLRGFLSPFFSSFQRKYYWYYSFWYPFPLLGQLCLPRTFSVCLIVRIVRGGGTRLRSRPSLFTCRSPSPRPHQHTAAVRRGKAHAAQRSLCVTQLGGKGDLFLVQAAVGSVVTSLSAKTPRAASPLWSNNNNNNSDNNINKQMIVVLLQCQQIKHQWNLEIFITREERNNGRASIRLRISATQRPPKAEYLKVERKKFLEQKVAQAKEGGSKKKVVGDLLKVAKWWSLRWPWGEKTSPVVC